MRDKRGQYEKLSVKTRPSQQVASNVRFESALNFLVEKWVEKLRSLSMEFSDSTCT